MANTTIKYLQGARFTPTEVESTNIGSLRRELGIQDGATISVNGTDVPDSYELSADDQVAAVVSNKTGGHKVIVSITII